MSVCLYGIARGAGYLTAESERKAPTPMSGSGTPLTERDIAATTEASDWAMLRRAVHLSGEFMRAAFYALIVAIGLAAHLTAQPAHAQPDRAAAMFWKTVQATCDATSKKPPGELGQRIAKTAIDECTRFG